MKDPEYLIRAAIKQALDGTNEFDSDGVILGSLVENQGAAANLSLACFIEPDSTNDQTLSDDFPDGLVQHTCMMRMTFAARDNDPETRDRLCGGLRAVAFDALKGQSFTADVVPALTRMMNWKWQPAAAPERQIKANFRVVYLTEGDDDLAEPD